jgi:hypothetical protein
MLTAAFCVCLALGGCSSVSGFVSDSWPTWAGGMPKDVPPRPGAPGYEEFLAHQQRQDVPPNTAAAPGTAPGATTVGTAPAAAPGTTAAVPPPAAPPPARNANTQPQPALPPAYARPDDRSATQGGLY